MKIILDIRNQLLDMGVAEDKILLMSEDKNQDNKILYPRVQFLSDCADMFSQHNIKGSIAECGVYRGHFAQKMNELFPDRTLYLFDTFSGVDKRDIQCESETIGREFLLQVSETLAETNKDVVMLKFKYRKNVIIKYGFVPDTFNGLEKERFLFVNLDMDLYQPTIAALRFFIDKIVDEGAILVHDYFIDKNTPYHWGARKAVEDFFEEYPIVKLPIGDNRSIAIIRKY